MKRRDLLASTAVIPLAFAAFTPRVPKEWSEPDIWNRAVLIVSMGPSPAVGAAPCLDEDDYTQPRLPWGAPSGTPPNRIVG